MIYVMKLFIKTFTYFISKHFDLNEAEEGFCNASQQPTEAGVLFRS